MSMDPQKGVGLLKTKYVEQAPKSPALGFTGIELFNFHRVDYFPHFIGSSPSTRLQNLFATVAGLRFERSARCHCDSDQSLTHKKGSQRGAAVGGWRDQHVAGRKFGKQGKRNEK